MLNTLIVSSFKHFLQILQNVKFTFDSVNKKILTIYKTVFTANPIPLFFSDSGRFPERIQHKRMDYHDPQHRYP